MNRRQHRLRSFFSLVAGCGFCAALAIPACAQEKAATATINAVVASDDAREVLATGRAVITTRGGIEAATQAAVADALRNAVERTLGVYVSAQTLTQNYALVRDQVVTRADGFAVLKRIERTQTLPGEVRVRVRATVSLRPLAERLKALNLTRVWRVRVVAGRGKGSVNNADAAGEAVAALEQALADAGFPVVSDARPQAADLVVTVTPQTETTARTPLDTAAGPMTMYSVRGRLSVRATRTGTGETVANLTASEDAAHIRLSTARQSACADAANALAPRLANALLILPARVSQPVTLVVTGVPNRKHIQSLDVALETVTGVRAVFRRSWINQTATYELDVLSAALPLVSDSLETAPALRPFRLRITSETAARLVASARPR